MFHLSFHSYWRLQALIKAVTFKNRTSSSPFQGHFCVLSYEKLILGSSINYTQCLCVLCWGGDKSNAVSSFMLNAINDQSLFQTICIMFIFVQGLYMEGYLWDTAWHPVSAAPYPGTDLSLFPGMSYHQLLGLFNHIWLQRRIWNFALF